MFYTYLNDSQYDNTFVYLVFTSQTIFYCLHNTLVLSFDIDIVLTISIWYLKVTGVMFVTPLSNVSMRLVSAMFC